MPRLLTFTEFLYTADLFDFTEDANGNRVYGPAGSVSLSLSGDPVRGLQIWSMDPLRARQRLTNVRDRDGLLIHPSSVNDTGITWEVNNTVPVLNVWGQREMFQSQAKPV